MALGVFWGDFIGKWHNGIKLGEKTKDMGYFADTTGVLMGEITKKAITEFVDKFTKDNYNKNLSHLLSGGGQIAAFNYLINKIKKNEFKSIEEIKDFLETSSDLINANCYKAYENLMAISKNSKKQ